MMDMFSVGSVPLMARGSYRHEVVTASTLPAAVSTVEGAVAGVVAQKLFGVSPMQLAAIVAAPMFANLTSFVWARLSRGRHKVPFITGIMVGLLGCVVGIGLLPRSGAGSWGLIGLVVAARCCMSGIITLRSTLWRHNYPRHARGTITARLARLNSLIMFVAPLVGAAALDWHEGAFRYLYLGAACVASIGVWRFSRIRMRQELPLLKYEREASSRLKRHGDAAPLYEYEPQRDGGTSFWRVLREDSRFRAYMTWQFFAGVSNMMLEPVIIALAASRSEGMKLDYLIASSITHTAPVLMVLLTLGYWGRRLDRMHVARFRVTQAVIWIVAQIVMYIGALWSGSVIGALVLLLSGRLILGVARGGGALAWNLGHNDFASRQMVAVYMGIHVTLTGVRGAFAPFMGVLLYAGWDSVSISGEVVIPGWSGIGAHVFAVAAVLSSVACLGFWNLARQIETPE
jgi:hypothetical protein